MKVDFRTTAFILVKPPSRIISQHRLKNNAEYQALAERALANGHCLYFAPMTKRDGKYVVTQPWQLDIETIPQPVAVEEVVVEAEPVISSSSSDQLCCPFCDKHISSTPGRTLHVKKHHAERLGEYTQWLKSLGKKSKR